MQAGSAGGQCVQTLFRIAIRAYLPGIVTSMSLPGALKMRRGNPFPYGNNVIREGQDPPYMFLLFLFPGQALGVEES